MYTDKTVAAKLDPSEVLYEGPLYIFRDGNMICVTTFDPATIAPPEWPESDYAFGINPGQALQLLSDAKGWKY